MIRVWLVLIVLIVLLSGGIANAQLSQEIQQVAKLQIYITEIEKGYKIVQKGLTTISDIKNGHFSLDRDFYATLSAVNSSISGSDKVAQVRALSGQVSTTSSNSLTFAGQSGSFSSGELSYISLVFSQLNTGCDNLISALNKLLSNGVYQMSDDQRMKGIDGIFTDMEDRYSFSEHFSQSILVLALQRKRDQQGAKTLKALY